MLSITDKHGNLWEVAVGKASFGNLVLLFSRADSDIVLSHSVTASSRLEAEQALQDMDVRELRLLLREASPWTGRAGGSGG